MRLSVLTLLAGLSTLAAVPSPPATAGPIAEALARWLDDGGDAAGVVPAGVTVRRDIAYGVDPAQRYDIYLPAGRGEARAAVIVMVHGGGWKRGDKAADRVVTNKVARWVPRGAMFVSINYRLLPRAGVEEQVRDVARAIAHVQLTAAAHGGDAGRLILMGHSAGAHLAALVSADPAMVAAAGGRAWLGTIALDSAALDVPAVMGGRHLPLYDAAFGADPGFWQRMSPLHRLSARSLPVLAVCSTRRPDAPCDQAQSFVTRARNAGARLSELRGEALGHAEINGELGLPGAYTEAVEAFMARLDPAFGGSPRR